MFTGRRALVWLVLIALMLTGCEVADFFRELESAAQSSDELLLGLTPTAIEQSPAAAITGLDEGLAALQSYRALLQLEVMPSRAAPAMETIAILQEIIRPEQKLHYSMESRGDPVTAGKVEYFQDGQEFYLLTSAAGVQGDCERMTSEQASFIESARGLTPEEIFGPIVPGRLVQSGEIVNGIVTNRYAVDLAAMGLGDGNRSRSEVWVAQEGGYVVRFTGETEGVLTGFGTGQPGQGMSRWTYDLQQVNSLDVIHLSAPCLAAKAAAERIPIHPSALNLNTYGGVTTYQSEEDLAALVDFYRSELAERGWLVNERVSFDSLVILDARFENQSIEVTLTAAETNNQVMIREQ